MCPKCKSRNYLSDSDGVVIETDLFGERNRYILPPLEVVSKMACDLSKTTEYDPYKGDKPIPERRLKKETRIATYYLKRYAYILDLDHSEPDLTLLKLKIANESNSSFADVNAFMNRYNTQTIMDQIKVSARINGEIAKKKVEWASGDNPELIQLCEKFNLDPSEPSIMKISYLFSKEKEYLSQYS